ncbi:MAG TPA: NAD(+)/NADH kinase [Ignavibacteriaceae bacterium]|nr:NAD(+)/NADH kinase [Ignavibacteriaceae bacterium]
MKPGIVGNIHKENIASVVTTLIEKLSQNKIPFSLCDTLKQVVDLENKDLVFSDIETLAMESDILISIGGDGTMLTTAYTARQFDKPVLGVNYGKLGFLAEVDIHGIDLFIDELIHGKYSIEERIVLCSYYAKNPRKEFFAINDLVIGKGDWPKMIEITVKVDDEYVTTFSADGLIIATPTGSTGYSLSVGGPVITPKADVIALSPISPHSLTMRPLILSSSQVISVFVESLNTKIQINCDGQRVEEHVPPVELKIFKSDRPLKLIRTASASYFDILRTKLFWGLDVRKSSLNNLSNKK